MPQAYFVLKAPGTDPLYIRGPYVKTPKLTKTRRDQRLAQVYALPCYSTPEEVTIQEKTRQLRIIGAVSEEDVEDQVD